MMFGAQKVPAAENGSGQALTGSEHTQWNGVGAKGGHRRRCQRSSWHEPPSRSLPRPVQRGASCVSAHATDVRSFFSSLLSLLHSPFSLLSSLFSLLPSLCSNSSGTQDVRALTPRMLFVESCKDSSYACFGHSAATVYPGAGAQEEDAGLTWLKSSLSKVAPVRPSRRRDCHFADTPCLSLLKHLLEAQRGCHQMTVSPTASQAGLRERRANRGRRPGARTIRGD